MKEIKMFYKAMCILALDLLIKK